MTVKFLDRSIVPVIAEDECTSAYMIWLMKLDDKGELDFGQEQCDLGRAKTRDMAIEYAKKIADYIGIRVIEIGSPQSN